MAAPTVLLLPVSISPFIAMVTVDGRMTTYEVNILLNAGAFGLFRYVYFV